MLEGHLKGGLTVSVRLDTLVAQVPPEPPFGWSESAPPATAFLGAQDTPPATPSGPLETGGVSGTKDRRNRHLT